MCVGGVAVLGAECPELLAYEASALHLVFETSILKNNEKSRNWRQRIVFYSQFITQMWLQSCKSDQKFHFTYCSVHIFYAPIRTEVKVTSSVFKSQTIHNKVRHYSLRAGLEFVMMPQPPECWMTSMHRHAQLASLF